MDSLANFSTRRTAQNRPADPRQKANRAGGYTFQVSDAERLRRFLTLGTDGGTFYAGSAELVEENAGVVLKMARDAGETLVATIVDVSTRGAAPKQNPALFALAIAAAHGDAGTRRAALDALPAVARTGTHLFTFAKYVEQFRGWGRGLRNAVAGWYTAKPADRLAYQVVKYRQRGGWSHRDLLRLSHPKATDPGTRAVFDWVTSGATGDDTPALIEGFLKAADPNANHPKLVSDYGLSWEMLPTEALNNPAVWEALLARGMPQTALMRQLPRLTRLGLLRDRSVRSGVVSQLTDPTALAKARVHPINVLVAQRTYAVGVGQLGTKSWDPDRRIVDALDAAFYAAFGAVTPADRRTLLALDVSGSMGFQTIAGMPLTPREASAALALVQLATEPDADTVAFTAKRGSRYSGVFGQAAVRPLDISPRQRLDDAVRSVSNLPFGPTDCALPMEYALENGMEVDTFVVYTDSETWAGRSHPHQALKRYREATGIDAKMVVVGMTATDASIADPTDPGMLDIAGFDAAVPNLINDFSRGL